MVSDYEQQWANWWDRQDKLDDGKERAPSKGNIDWPDYEPLQDTVSKAPEGSRKRFNKLRAMIDPDHDLDGTALPGGHEEYTAQQERFDLLWHKCLSRVATKEEKAEMLRMQEQYWSTRNDL